VLILKVSDRSEFVHESYSEYLKVDDTGLVGTRFKFKLLRFKRSSCSEQ
jgi:hypothetical protein